MSEKYTFDDFLSTVDGDNREFVRELHEELTKLGCKTEIKQAMSSPAFRIKRRSSTTYSAERD